MTEPSRPGLLLDSRQVASLQDDLAQRIRLHPQWPDLWNLRGLLEAHEGRLDGARVAFEEALQRHGDYAAARWNLAWIEALHGRATRLPADTPPEVKGALGFVRNMVAHVEPGRDWTGDRAGLVFLALLHAASTDSSAALTEARERLVAVLPDADQLLEAAGWSSSGRPAARELRALSHPERLHPGFAELMLRAAYLESLTGRDENAERLQARAALYRGDAALYLVERGEAASRRGESDLALELLREAVSVSPDWYRAHQALGYELSLRGIIGESLHHFEEAVRLEPRFADLLYQWGLLLHAAGLNNDAMDAMGRALTANPRYLVARIALANLLFEASRAADAAPHYEHVMDEGIETASLVGRLGYSLHAAGDRNRAEELFLEAIARHHDRPELLTHYGQFLMETDRRVEARTVWERAVSADPAPRLRAELESLLEKSSERGEADE